MQSHGLVAALCSLGVPGVVAAGGVGLPVTVSPGVGVALSNGGFALFGLVDGDVDM